MNGVCTDISGVILAGGKGTRMGFPKSFLTVKGIKVIDTVLNILKSSFEEVFMVTDDKERFNEFKNVKVVEDLIRGCGPLGGIYAGLKGICNDAAFFVACDMPFLHTDLIERQISMFKELNCDCLVPRWEGAIEPLHAVYSKSSLPQVEICLRTGELAVKEFLSHINCCYMDVDAKESGTFYNINTPQELKKIEDN